VAELATLRPGGDVRDDVELLPRLEKCGLQRKVIARRDEQLVRHAALAQQRRQRCEEPMDPSRHGIRVQQCVELVVERSGTFHDRDVLSDSRQPVAVSRVFEPSREVRREVGDVGAEDRDQASIQQRLEHVLEVVLRWRRRPRRSQAALLPENRAV
jgi:hypothetical protein